jgi:hypothetical protein
MEKAQRHDGATPLMFTQGDPVIDGMGLYIKVTPIPVHE